MVKNTGHRLMNTHRTKTGVNKTGQQGNGCQEGPSTARNVVDERQNRQADITKRAHLGD